MPIKVIDNKRVDLTIDEIQMYQKIVASYTTATNRGEDLFIDLFETNEQGTIIFLKPPSTRRIPLEVFLFLVCIFEQQHVRLMYQNLSDMSNQLTAKMQEYDQKIKDLDDRINQKGN
jgi:hypothetical protein